MAEPFVIPGDLIIRGETVMQGGGDMPTGSVGNDQVEAAAGIDPTKLGHLHVVTRYFGSHTTDAAASRIVAHNAYVAGTLVAFVAGSTVAATSTGTATIEFKKNGTTVLSAAVVLDSGNTAFVVEAGTVSVSAYVAGDTFEAEITAVSGSTVPKGVFFRAVFSEGAIP